MNGYTDFYKVKTENIFYIVTSKFLKTSYISEPRD